MIIKTQSICICGNNLSEIIPPFLSNESMELNLIWLEVVVNKFYKNKKLILSKNN